MGRIHVIGAGAIGTYLAAALARSARCSQEVQLVARAETARRLSAGLFVIGEGGGPLAPGEVSLPVKSLEEWRGAAPGDLILLTVKAAQLRSVLAWLRDREPAGGTPVAIYLLQNGLEILREAEGVLSGKAERLGRGLCWLGARLDRTGARWALHLAGGLRIELAGGLDADRQTLASALEAAGFEVAFGGSVAELEWRKGLCNAALNGLCALAEVPNGQALRDPGLRELLEGLLDECAQVAQATGVHLSPDYREQVFALIQATESNFNSTLIDLREGRATEIPWLNGAIVRLGDSVGVPTPLNRMISRLIAAREGARSGT